MYCSKCGYEVCKEAKFCHECGSGCLVTLVVGSSTATTSRKRPQPGSQPSSQPSGHSDSVSSVTFEQFREKKQKERTGWFKNKKGSSGAKSEKKVSEVNIQIGFMKFREGDLKIVRGSTLPLKVFPTITSIELHKRSVEKMLKFNKDIYGDPNRFTLVYPDRTEVKFLPGSTEVFTLQRYKEELGKAYARITLYLCKTGEYFDAVFSESMKFLDDIDDNEDSHTINQLLESSLDLAVVTTSQDNSISVNCSTETVSKSSNSGVNARQNDSNPHPGVDGNELSNHSCIPVIKNESNNSSLHVYLVPTSV